MKKSLKIWLQNNSYSLALSSSFFGFYAHCGVATALWEEGLYPAKLSGSSAGALVGGALAAGLRPEEMAEICFTLDKKDFWDPGFGLGYLRGKKFAKILNQFIPKDFKELEIPLDVAVYNVLQNRTEFLHSGPLVPALVASCAVPLLFQPVRIGRKLYLDGGLFEKAGFRATAEERVLCIFLESSGISGAYEQGKDLLRFGGNHKALRFTGLPKVRPHKLAAGRAAYQEAYARTKAALASPATGSIIEA